MGLPLLLLVLAVFAPIIRLGDGGPVFYSAPRLGKGGRIFMMYKLRSMRHGVPDLRNADGSTYNGENDPRVTPVGRLLRKTSLDEAPQLINVLRGDMSVVGPRPDLPDALGLYGDAFQWKLAEKPGITGYNQAYYRNTVDMDARLKNDVYYVTHMSFLLDLRILVKTAVRVLKGAGVYSSAQKGRTQ